MASQTPPSLCTDGDIPRQLNQRIMKITVFRIGQRSDGLYYIILHKTVVTVFGNTVVTGFIATETEPAVAEGDLIDEPKNIKIDWKA